MTFVRDFCKFSERIGFQACLSNTGDDDNDDDDDADDEAEEEEEEVLTMRVGVVVLLGLA